MSNAWDTLDCIRLPFSNFNTLNMVVWNSTSPYSSCSSARTNTIEHTAGMYYTVNILTGIAGKLTTVSMNVITAATYWSGKYFGVCVLVCLYRSKCVFVNI